MKRAAATRWREASVRELTIKLRSILIIAAVGAPSRSTLRESESGALGENLFELATLNVFSHSSSEFHSRFSRRAAQGYPQGRLAGAAFSLATLLLAAQKKVAGPGSATRKKDENYVFFTHAMQ